MGGEVWLFLPTFEPCGWIIRFWQTERWRDGRAQLIAAVSSPGAVNTRIFNAERNRPLELNAGAETTVL